MVREWAIQGCADRQGRRRRGHLRNNLRTQDRISQTANKLVNGRNCLELGGLWIDEGFTADMKTVVVKAQSDAYFKILELYPRMKDVYRLGNHLVLRHAEQDRSDHRHERRQEQAHGRGD